MFERFTDRARKVLVLAQEEAGLLDHNFIGTEHLLLGLISEGEGVAARVLESLGISLEVARARVVETIGPAASSISGPPPFTPRAKKVLELSLREALQLGHNYIGTEHILLGIAREGAGVAAQVLVDLGSDPSRVRKQVMGLLLGSEDKETVAPGSVAIQVRPAFDTEHQLRTTAHSGTPPDCPHCRSALATSMRLRRFDLVDEASGTQHAFVVVYCDTCGRSLSFKPVSEPGSSA